MNIGGVNGLLKLIKPIMGPIVWHVFPKSKIHRLLRFPLSVVDITVAIDVISFNNVIATT